MKNVKLDENAIGKHLIANLHGIKNATHFDDVTNMKEILLEATKKAKMTVVGEAWHKFEGQGLTGVILLSTSHISIHFWPEYQFLHMDIFTCGNEGDPKKAFDFIIKMLKPNMRKSNYMIMDRNIF